MTNTNTTPAAAPKRTRRPSAATQRARLKEAGIDTEGFTPKALKEAFDAHAADAPTTRPAPAPVAEAAPAPAPVKEKKQPRNCGCGCGAPCVTAKASFLSGHDARFAGMVGRGEVEPEQWQRDLITPALQAKIDGITQTVAKRLAAKKAKEAAKVAAKAAYDKAMATV